MERHDLSPFVDDHPDENFRRRYTFHARENYEQNKEMRFSAQRGHLEYGKWLIASMLAIHGGAIYAISSIRTSLPLSVSHNLVNAAVCHVFGICLIMVSAFMAWLNFQCAEVSYFKLSNPAMVYRTDTIHDEDERRDPVTATLFAAAISGILSWLAFIMGAAEVFRALRSISAYG